jgi:hypothetical protein
MILMFLDDVLRTPKGSPLYQGTALYHALKDSKKLSILAKDRTDAERWLKASGISKFDEILDYSYITATEDKDLRLVEYCRSQGKVDLVITANIELSKYLLEQGIHTLLFLHPTYIRPEFRPDGRGRRAWDAVVEELDKQQDLYADDRRVQ